MKQDRQTFDLLCHVKSNDIGLYIYNSFTAENLLIQISTYVKHIMSFQSYISQFLIYVFPLSVQLHNYTVLIFSACKTFQSILMFIIITTTYYQQFISIYIVFSFRHWKTEDVRRSCCCVGRGFE